jgi:hypothetical protein
VRIDDFLRNLTREYYERKMGQDEAGGIKVYFSRQFIQEGRDG